MPVPIPPANVIATPGDGQLNLTFTASPGATGYNVNLGTTSGGESGTPFAGSPFAGSPIVVAPLVNGTLYYLTVSAVNGSGTSPASGEVSMVPSASIPTDHPKGHWYTGLLRPYKATNRPPPRSR